MDKSLIKTERLMTCALGRMLRPLFSNNIFIGENGTQLVISTANSVHAIVNYEKERNSVFISVYHKRLNLRDVPHFDYTFIPIADPDFKNKIRSIICDHLKLVGVSYE